MINHKQHQPGIYELALPANSGPVVVDSPHSGRHYPDDFLFVCDFDDLRRTEDLLLDHLLADLPSHGAPVLLAEFPRSYIDVNRTITDIDDALLDRPWPGPIDHAGRSYAGIGLIRRLLRPGVEIYDHPLSVNDIRHRISTYYTPYHQILDNLISHAQAQHGTVLHLNMHSFTPQIFAAPDPHKTNAIHDIVISNRDGATCAPHLMRRVGYLFNECGYRVGYNHLFKGVEIIKRHGQPHLGRHSLQIEINKSLYVFEKSLALKPAAEKLRTDINQIITQLQADLLTSFHLMAAD